jgi:hypothetical protein
MAFSGSNLELIDFFIDKTNSGTKIGTPKENQLLLVEAKGYRNILTAYMKAIASVKKDGYVVIIIHLESTHPIQALMNFVTLRYRLLQAKRIIKRSGATTAGLFGISPNLASPTIIFPLGGVAAQYAERNLLPRSAKFSAFLLKALSWWAGCDVSVGTLLAAGRKS